MVVLQVGLHEAARRVSARMRGVVDQLLSGSLQPSCRAWEGACNCVASAANPASRLPEIGYAMLFWLHCTPWHIRLFCRLLESSSSLGLLLLPQNQLLNQDSIVANSPLPCSSSRSLVILPLKSTPCNNSLSSTPLSPVLILTTARVLRPVFKLHPYTATWLALFG